MIRRIIATPATALLLAAVPLKHTDVKTVVNSEEPDHYKRKPSELPLYEPLHETKNVSADQEQHLRKESALHQTLESGVRVVRIGVQSGIDVVADQMKYFDDYWNTAKAHTQSTMDYLNEPQNVLPRSGAIAIGGLSGFIFAARGGFIKKVVYTTIGAGTVAAICYPRQAEDFARDVLTSARKTYTIAYNFAKGVKPGDETQFVPVNKFPTSMEDLKFLALDLYDEAKEAVFGKK